MLPSSSGIEDVNLIVIVEAYPVHRIIQVSTISWRCWRRTLILFPCIRYWPANHWKCLWHMCLFT